MNNRTYIQNLFYSFLKKTDSFTDHLMFMKHNNSMFLTRDEMTELMDEDYRESFIYHDFSINKVCEPYEPFLDGIKLMYDRFFAEELDVDSFLAKCGVYSLQREVFATYIKTGLAERTEPLITSEIIFETTKFLESVLGCYRFISTERDVLIVLNRFQYACNSTCELIKKIMDSDDRSGVKLLVIYNEGVPIQQFGSKQRDEILSRADDMGLMYEWEGRGRGYSGDYHIAFVPLPDEIASHIKKINNLYHALAIDDAQYYINEIHKRIVDDKLKISKSDRFDLYYYAAMCYVLKKDVNSALMTCDRLTDLYDKENDIESDYRFNYLSGQIQMSTVSSELTVKFAEKCIEDARLMKNDELLFQAEVLFQAVQFGGWRDVFSVNFSLIELDSEMIEKLRKHNFLNTLAYYLIFGYDNDEQAILKMANGESSETFREAIRLGWQLGNTCFLLSAYTKYIVMFSERGYNKGIEKFYMEKLNILNKEHNERRKAHLLMGMGYNSIVNEDYIKADSDFMEAIKILYKMRNAEEIAEALYNMTSNSICAENYSSAYEYMSTLFIILDNLGIETIRICNPSKLHGMFALIYYKLGNEYKCFKQLESCKGVVYPILGEDMLSDENKDYNNWNEDVYLYYLISALLEKSNENYKEAERFFGKAMFYFRKCQSVAFYSITTLICEYYDFYKKINDAENAFKILDFGLAYCKEHGFNQKAKNILAYTENKTIVASYSPVEYPGMDINGIIDLSYNVGKENQLQESRKDIRFLSMWQEMLNRDDLVYSELISSAMVILQKNYNLDEVVLLDITDGNISVTYEDTHQEKLDYEEIVEIFSRIKKEFVINRDTKAINEYERLTGMFDRRNIVSLIGVPLFEDNELSGIFVGIVNNHINYRHIRKMINSDNLVIIKTAIIQLRNGIERIINKQNIIDINEKLNRLAVTDMMTGLYNRQGFDKMLEQNANSHDTVAILYADLDNFKYYNDTFGHDVGDVILKEFSKLISDISKNIGYAVRYGGDEFLIILNNIDKSLTLAVADTIYKRISSGFVSEVSRYMQKDVTIPEDKLVSCSIGIAFSPDGSKENITRALKCADQALYYMKKRTKGDYKIWDETMEEQQ